MGRSKGPDKNKDAEGKLTRAGVAANKATTPLKIKKINLEMN